MSADGRQDWGSLSFYSFLHLSVGATGLCNGERHTGIREQYIRKRLSAWSGFLSFPFLLTQPPVFIVQEEVLFLPPYLIALRLLRCPRNPVTTEPEPESRLAVLDRLGHRYPDRHDYQRIHCQRIAHTQRRRSVGPAAGGPHSPERGQPQTRQHRPR